MDAFLPRPVPVQELAPARRALRVAVVTETYPPEVNGVANTIGQLVEALRLRNHHVQLVRPRQGPDDEGAAADHLEQVLRPGLPIPRHTNLRMGLPARGALLRLWRARRPDVVHVVTEGPLGWSALSAARHLRLPVTSAFHTNFHTYSAHYGLGWLKTPIARYLRRFHNLTRLTLVATEAMRRELARQGFHNLEVLARGVDTAHFHPARRSGELRARWGARAGDPVALYVGRLAPEKNLPLLYAAHAALRARHGRARLVVVGDGPMAQELRRAWPDAVFAGMRSGEDLAIHYASADVFLFPSLTETYGNVTLEAMASGLAVVAFDYAAAHELITHGENGLLAPFGSAGDFCAQAATLADSDRVRALGLAARRRAAAMDWSRIHDRFETLLAAVIEEMERSLHAAGLPPGARPAQ